MAKDNEDTIKVRVGGQKEVVSGAGFSSAEEEKQLLKKVKDYMGPPPQDEDATEVPVKVAEPKYKKQVTEVVPGAEDIKEELESVQNQIKDAMAEDGIELDKVAPKTTSPEPQSEKSSTEQKVETSEPNIAVLKKMPEKPELEKPKSGKFAAIKGFFGKWWRNKWARNLSIVGFVLVLLGLFVVPSTR